MRAQRIPANADEVYPGWVPASPAASASPSALASPTPQPGSPSLSPSPAATLAPVAEPAPPAEPAPFELHAESAAGPLDDGGASTGHDVAPGSITAQAAPGVHVVVRGESLWRITAELLGPDASNSAIASAWPVIYQANRSLIGENPGLIQPGQRLTIPQEVAA